MREAKVLTRSTNTLAAVQLKPHARPHGNGYTVVSSPVESRTTDHRDYISWPSPLFLARFYNPRWPERRRPLVGMEARLHVTRYTSRPVSFKAEYVKGLPSHHLPPTRQRNAHRQSHRVNHCSIFIPKVKSNASLQKWSFRSAAALVHRQCGVSGMSHHLAPKGISCTQTNIRRRCEHLSDTGVARCKIRFDIAYRK